MSNYTVRVVIDDKGNESKASVKKKKTTKTAVQKNQFQLVKNKSAIAIGGTLLGTASVVNSFVGDYTENRLLEKRIGLGIKFAGYGLAVASGNPIAILAVAGDIAQTRLRYDIKLQKQDIRSNYIRQISGNASLSGNRGR